MNALLVLVRLKKVESHAPRPYPDAAVSAKSHWICFSECPPPAAPCCPIAMIGISARPACSLGKMLHHLHALRTGATPEILLRRMRPFQCSGPNREFAAAQRRV